MSAMTFTTARVSLLLGLVLIGVLVAAPGCGSTDCSFTATCAGGSPTGDGGPDGSPDGGPVIPNDCDLTKSPKDSTACVDDNVGIFVDHAGKPSALGTMKDPLPSIAVAIAKAAGTNRKRVYVCDGTYDEAIKLSSALSVYGGFECGTWKNTGVKPRVAPVRGSAIEVRSVVDEVVIEDIDAKGSSDPNVKGSSAIGAFVAHSKVTMRRVVIAAGAGQDGAKGGSLSNYLAPAAGGFVANGALGGGEKTCTCGDGTKSIGGHGADGNGGNFTDGSAVPGVANGNAGVSMSGGCTAGTVGLPGEPDAGGNPIQPPGVIVEGGWDASPIGGTGKNGLPGQGGGGGGAKTASSSAGGGGACGGCGGAGAEAGKNGGASIGLLALDSTILVEACTVSSTTGGKGGTGGDGQPGQDGSALGGTGACDGGPGGPGAGGSGGAGGAGGDSFAIAWKGAAQPTLTATVPTAGTPGSPGDAGAFGAGSGKPGNPGKLGIVGRSQPIFTQ